MKPNNIPDAPVIEPDNQTADVAYGFGYFFFTFPADIDASSVLTDIRQDTVTVLPNYRITAENLAFHGGAKTRYSNTLNNKKHYILLRCGRYALLSRENELTPYIVACGYDDKTGEWNQGYYAGKRRKTQTLLFSTVRAIFTRCWATTLPPQAQCWT